jgi:hypothetical protein
MVEEYCPHKLTHTHTQVCVLVYISIFTYTNIDTHIFKNNIDVLNR